MAKPVLQLAAIGVVGVVLWKLLAGVVFGLLFTIIKIAFIVGLICFGVWAFRRFWSEKKPDDKTEQPAEGTT